MPESYFFPGQLLNVTISSRRRKQGGRSLLTSYVDCNERYDDYHKEQDLQTASKDFQEAIDL